jgi:hypothetical protein
MQFPSAVLAAAMVLGSAHGARAHQGARVIDEGSFTITLGGQRAGREDFRIAATPRGSSVEHMAQATVTYGDRRLNPALVADAEGVPARYEIVSRGGDAGQEQWKGTIFRGRVSAQIQTATGASAKEYVVTEGALILDDDIIHQYYFVARHRSAGSVTVVIPRRNTQLRLTFSTGGTETLAIGTQQIESSRLILTEPSGATREVWVDSENRVLKVAIPSRNLVAMRDDPPR